MQCYPLAMKLTFTKRSALAIIRSLRAGGSKPHALGCRTSVTAPDLGGSGKRWTRKRIAALESELGLDVRLAKDPLEIAVPSAAARLRSSFVSSTVYAGCVPARSFVDIGGGLAVSAPELLFVEMAEVMGPIEHLMLGHELCGSFSRDAGDPYDGSITYGVPPLTSVGKITCFLESASRIRGITKARRSLAYLNDNAWSPTESLVTAFLRLPIDDLGYEFGSLTLNPRKYFERQLPGAKESRVPDIVIDGTPVGLNYDGLTHLDLKSIARAGIELGMNPGVSQTQLALDQAIEAVRAKAVDDIRRNRELAADGLQVFPLLKEDLYMPGGLDQVVVQLVRLIEESTGMAMEAQRRILRSRVLSEARHRMILSFLPGKNERNVQVGRFIGGHKVYEGPSVVHECWIEL